MKSLTNRTKGVALAEAAAAMLVLVPLAFLLMYAIAETSIAYNIKNTLAEAARKASRDLAVQYGVDPTIANNRDKQDELVFNHVRIQNIVNSSVQFDDPAFDTANAPHSVRVVVRYLGGQFNLPPFPNPDPLNLGPRFQITAESTYRLE